MTVPNVIEAFSEEQAQRLTGLTQRQLRHWDRVGLVVPELADDDRSSAYSRVYSFLDIVSLRTLSVLRSQYGISLQHLRKIAQKMREMDLNIWIGTTLYVLNRRVIFEEPGTGKPREIATDQYVLPIPLRVVVSDARKAVEELWRRPGEQIGRIERHRNVSSNVWVIAGTRIHVASIKRLAEDGYGVAEIQAEYPQLTEEDIRAALSHGDSRAAA